MDYRPRNLKTMLSEAKDTSELMIDLSYAAVYFGDAAMADEVCDLEARLSEVVHEMRAVCVMAARSPRDADAMASVLQVVSAIERMGNAAVDVGRVVTHRLGIPRALVADLAAAEEVSHRVRIRDGSAMAHRSLEDLELPVEVGMRVVAIHRDRDWMIDPDGSVVVVPGDVVFLRGSPNGVAQLRTLAGAPEWQAPQVEEEPAVTDLDRAIDALVEMKNISEVAVGLAYSALVLRDFGLAAEVTHLEDRLDEMRERIELWVLRAARSEIDPSPLRGLVHLAQAAEEIGDAAQQMVWLLEANEELHPIIALALGDSDEVVARVPVGRGSRAEGGSLGQLQLELETGFYLLAIRRGGRYRYRPRSSEVLQADDQLIAIGPDEGQALLAELCGFELVVDPDTGFSELVPVAAQPGSLT